MMNQSELLNQMPSLFIAVCVGVALGTIFFGGLWWTVKKMQTVKQPALWFFTGFLLRMSIVLYGIYWVSDAQWQRLLACMLGFLLARFAVIRLTRMGDKKLLLKNTLSTDGSRPHAS